MKNFKITNKDLFYPGLPVLQGICWVVLLLRLSLGGGLYFMDTEQPCGWSCRSEAIHRSLPKEEIYNTVTFLSGLSTVGENAGLAIDEGQSMLGILKDDTEEGIYRELQATGPYGPEKKECLIFLFGTGLKSSSLKKNLDLLLHRRLAMSSVPPWERNLNLIILPDFDPESLGGALYLTGRNPDLPVFCPPLSEEVLKERFKTLRAIPRLYPLKPGFTRISSKLWALAFSGDGHEESPRLYLLISGEKGPVILSGTGKDGILIPLEKATAFTGKPAAAFAGGTGYLYITAGKALIHELNGIKRITRGDLSLYPNLNTTPASAEEMKKVFGSRLKESPLGGSFKTDNP